MLKYRHIAHQDLIDQYKPIALEQKKKAPDKKKRKG